MTIEFGEANKQKAPEGYEECHAIIGFDRQGDLRISETDEKWEPIDCDREFFVGNIQRVVFYHKAESRPVSPIQYFIMDNFSRDVRKFYHYKGLSETLIEKLPYAPGNTEQALTLSHDLVYRREVDNTGDYILAEESKPQKTADSLLSEILKRPMKTIFDKD